MSYTSFEISGCTLGEGEDAYTVTATVKNTGELDGAEVVQVYVGSKGAADDKHYLRKHGANAYYGQ